MLTRTRIITCFLNLSEDFMPFVPCIAIQLYLYYVNQQNQALPLHLLDCLQKRMRNIPYKKTACTTGLPDDKHMM